MPRKTARPHGPADGDLGGTRLIETLLAGWRALARIDVDGFALLRSRGVTKRADSVVPLAPPSDPTALAGALETIEQLAAASGGSPVHRLFEIEGIDHTGVRAALESRGFAPSAPTAILHRALESPGRVDPRARAAVGAPPREWLDQHWLLAPRPEDGARATIAEIMSGTPAVYIALHEAGREDALAVGRAALVPHRRGAVAVLDAIAVDQERRREGLGRATVQSLLALAAQQGASRAILEVESSNAPALGLYRSERFRPLGTYAYFSLPGHGGRP